MADLLAHATSTAMLVGNRLVWLLQVEDPRFRMNTVAEVQIGWNHREWRDADRL